MYQRLMRIGFAAAVRAALASKARGVHFSAHRPPWWPRPQKATSRGFTTGTHLASKVQQRWSGAAVYTAALVSATSAYVWWRRCDNECAAAAPRDDDAVLSTVPQMLSHISRRRNLRANCGEDGFVAWLQQDFGGKDQLFVCDTVSFEKSRDPQAVMLTQYDGGVKFMELVPDAEDCGDHRALRARAVVVCDAGGGDALHVVHVSSGSSSHNMLPPGLRVHSIVASPSRPEHLLLVMHSANASPESHCGDVYRLDLSRGHVTLDCRNPGFVTQWAADLSTLTVRACLCAHSPQLGVKSPAYVKARGRDAGPWVHVCELSNGGHVAGFSDCGESLVVMRSHGAHLTFSAEKHQLSPLFSAAGKAPKVVLCSNATGRTLALQDNVLFEATAANARVWRCSDASARPLHTHNLLHGRAGVSELDVDVSCLSSNGRALLVIAADVSGGCAHHRSMLLQQDGSITPFWSYIAPLPPADSLLHSIAVPDAPALEITALLPPVLESALAPAVLQSFTMARSSAQQRLHSLVLSHLLAEKGYTVISMDSSLWHERQATQSLQHAAQWAVLNRLCDGDRIALLQFGCSHNDDYPLSETFVCAVFIPIAHTSAESASAPEDNSENLLRVQLSSPAHVPDDGAVARMLRMFNRFTGT